MHAAAVAAAAAGLKVAAVVQKGRQRPSAGSRGGGSAAAAAAADAGSAEQNAEDVADAGQAAAEGRAKARGTEDAGSWLSGRVRRAGQQSMLLQASIESNAKSYRCRDDSRRRSFAHGPVLIRGAEWSFTEQ